MISFFLSTLFASPRSEWLSQQVYTHASLLPSDLSAEDKNAFAQKAHSYLIERYNHTKFSCHNNVTLHFPFPEENYHLKHTYALETSVCIPNMKWKNVFDMYMDPKFRAEHMPGVESATKNNDTLCVTTESFIGIVKPAYMCLKAHEYTYENGILVYSHLTATKQSPFQPIYFQEEYILFQQFGTHTLIHRLSVNRSRELGTTGGYVLRKKSEEYPDALINAMTNPQ